MASRRAVSAVWIAKASLRPPVSTNPASELTFRTLGNYSDQWVHEDGTWRITRRFKDNRATLGSFDVFRAE